MIRCETNSSLQNQLLCRIKNLRALKGKSSPNETVRLPKSAGSQAMKHLIERNKKRDRYLLSVPFTWLVRLDARVRVVCMVCATHVTSNMHPAACRDSCDNPILVKSLGLQIGSHWVPLIHASNIYIYIL